MSLSKGEEEEDAGKEVGVLSGCCCCCWVGFCCEEAVGSCGSREGRVREAP